MSNGIILLYIKFSNNFSNIKLRRNWDYKLHSIKGTHMKYVSFRWSAVWYFCLLQTFFFLFARANKVCSLFTRCLWFFISEINHTASRINKYIFGSLLTLRCNFCWLNILLLCWRIIRMGKISCGSSDKIYINS
jgi:hypothetical protein